MNGSLPVPESSVVRQIRTSLLDISDDAHAQVLQRYFKTGPGQYGQGDVFIGLRVLQLRTLARTYAHIGLDDVRQLLSSAIHEERLLALLIMVRSYSKADASLKAEIHGLYLDNTRFINNWDLVDLSAEHIIGAHLSQSGTEPLQRLARSQSLWERRMAVMATFHFIKKGRFSCTFSIVESLLGDHEDLIHKACGWMLREIGKRDLAAEEAFLRTHARTMPRTMLRYAIERFPEEKRQSYLKGTFAQD